MTEFQFAPATKAQAKARIALDGPSGSGKTWTALSVAMGLGQRIAVIDTERGSASKYAGDFRFDTLQMHTYDPRDLVKALSAAAGAGYDVVIVDSLSHFWMGKGGMLEQVDGFTKRSSSGNSFGGWKDARPIEREMIDGLLAYPGHVIVTMRTKTEWVITENDRGRKEPKKIGLKAEQRDGLEYEFDIVGDLDLDHNLVVSKSRMSALADKVISRPDSEVGGQILAWLTDGESLPTVEDYILRVMQTEDFAVVRETFAEVQQRGMGAAPCMRNGQPTTLRQLVFERGNELAPQQAPAAAASAPAASPTARDAADAVVRKEQMTRTRPSAPVEDEFTVPQPEPAQSIIDEPSDRQMKLLHVLLNKKWRGMTDEQRHAWFTEQAGREITSSKQLTKRDVHKMINLLQPPEQAPQDPPDQDFHLPSQIGPEGICSGLVDAMAEAADMDALGKLGARVADLKTKGVLHEDHLGRLESAWRARQQELAVAA